MRTTVVATFTALTLAACAAPRGPAGVPTPAREAPKYRLLFTAAPAGSPAGSATASAGAPNAVASPAAPTDPAAGEGTLVSLAPGARKALRVTAYQGDMGLIEDVRAVELPRGPARLRFLEVAPKLDASSVRLRAVGLQGALGVLEQRFAFDVLNAAALLQRYVGRTIAVRLPAEGDTPSKIVEAELLSAADGGIVRIDGMVYLKPPGELLVPDVPDGLTARPTLEWRVDASEGGPGSLVASYLTQGLAWEARYDLTLGTDRTKATIAAWASVANRTGIPLPDAQVTLVAGQPSRKSAWPMPMPYAADAVRASAPMEAGAGGGMEDRGLDVYRAYDMPGTTSFGLEESVQVALIAARSIPITRRFVFDGDRMGGGDMPVPVQSEVEVKNREADGLGRHLPAGMVRLWTDDGGQARFLGEDTIRHTPPDGKARINVGKAAGLTCERRMVSFTQVDKWRTQAAWRADLKNATDRPEVVELVEHPGGDWRVIASSHTPDRVAADELRFRVAVPAGGEVRATWTIEVKTAPPPDAPKALRLDR